MNESFVFEDIGAEPELPKPPPKSPWEFSGYSRTVAEEHAKRNTTSIDDKISTQRSHRRLPDREDEEGYRASKIDEEKIINEEESSDDEEEKNIEDVYEQRNNKHKNKQEGQNSKKIENKKQEVQNSKKIDVKRIEKKNVKSDEIEDDMPMQKDEEKNKDVRVNKKRKVKNKKEEEEDNKKRKVTDIEEEEEEKSDDVREEEEEKSDDVRVTETGHWDGESDESEEEAAEATKVEQPVRKANKAVKSGVNGKKSFFSTAEGASFNANSFAELNLSRPLLRACESLGYRKPTPIQAACIPIALTGRDICGSAITGSGKTAAFGLPVLERLLYRPKRIPAIRVLILTPTRELAVQIHSMVEKLGQFTDIRCCLVVGGLSMKNQEVQLRSRPDIVVATPGRMIDHLRNSQSVGLEDLAVLIFDEADRLLELGFSSEVEELVKGCPKRRQTMLFSATMTSGVDELIKLSLTSPVRLSADPLTKRPTALTEEVIKIRPAQEAKQEALLLALCTRSFTNKVIIFSGTKKEAHRLKILFGLSNLKAAELHGNLTQAQRLEALEKFRKQEVDFLIATDVAARGLDIIGVQTVINFACPRDITSYVHRVARTARAGKTGCAITFMTERDRKLLKSMARRAGSRLLSRRVADQSVDYWFGRIEEMEEDVNVIMLEEREEMILRKAEMEAHKAQNMFEHKDEIYSRPKRTWFESDKEKKVLAKASKDLKESDGSDKKQVTSVKEADKLERREKRKHENERNLPRKQRRKLQAAREMLEEDADNNSDKEHGSLKDKVQKAGKSLVEIGYRRAKSAKAAEKARETGKFVKTNNSKPKGQREKGRTKEMEDLFKNEMSSKKQKNSATGLHIGKKQSKRAFKSKSRYKRRK